jgi:hypothetical protein
MQYRPTAAELLADIAALLDDEVLDALSGPVQHKVRVAANLARILEREFLLADVHAAHERQLIAGLFGLPAHDPTPLPDLRARLAETLRQGQIPGRTDAEVWDALAAMTRDDLAIAKPGHDSWTGDEEDGR